MLLDEIQVLLEQADFSKMVERIVYSSIRDEDTLSVTLFVQVCNGCE